MKPTCFLPVALAVFTSISSSFAATPMRQQAATLDAQHQTYFRLLQLAQHGDAAAQEQLAQNYYLGRPFMDGAPFPAIPGFFERAPGALNDAAQRRVYFWAMQRAFLYWTQVSAAQHNPAAETQLGMVLFEPTCVFRKGSPTLPEDPVRAVALWRHAAKAQQMWAERGLAEAYRLGRGVEQDDQQAAVWYQRADAHARLIDQHTSLYDLFGNTTWVWNLQSRLKNFQQLVLPAGRGEQIVRRCPL